MRSKTNYLTFFKTSLLLFILQACAPTKEIGRSLEDYQQLREKYVETHIKKELGPDSSNYESIAYGKLIVTKPESFNELDSLYALKSRMLRNRSQYYQELKDLEEVIGVKRLELEPEIKNIVYEQEHVYSVQQDSNIAIHRTLVNLREQVHVKRIDELESNTIPQKLYPLFLRYFFNQTFVIPYYYYISQSEMEFYQLYKSGYENLVDEEEKNEFLIHTLETMKRSQKIKNLSARELLEMQLKEEVKIPFEIINFEIEELATGEIVAYYCVIETNQEGSNQFLEFRFDVYLQTMEF